MDFLLYFSMKSNDNVGSPRQILNDFTLDFNIKSKETLLRQPKADSKKLVVKFH